MIRLLSNDIACIPIEDPDRTESGLWVPDQAKQRVDQGIVKYTGPECEAVARGDHVLFGGYTGQKLSVEDEGVLYIMKETDVVAVFPDSTERIVTETEILGFLESVEGRLKIRDYGFPPEMVEKAVEVLESEITDYFHAEGLEF